ncbi:hypothetical protein [Roseivivax sp. CAU 1753]
MSMIASFTDRAVPRLSTREFTLCKAALLVGLIALGQWASHVKAGDDGHGPVWRAASCDSIAPVADDRQV